MIQGLFFKHAKNPLSVHSPGRHRNLYRSSEPLSPWTRAFPNEAGRDFHFAQVWKSVPVVQYVILDGAKSKLGHLNILINNRKCSSSGFDCCKDVFKAKEDRL